MNGVDLRKLHLYLVLVILAILGVSIDLYTTKIGLSNGLTEMNPLGNRPFIYYPWMIGVVTLVFWYGDILLKSQQEPFKSKFSKIYVGSSVFVSLLPYFAVIWNVIQIGWL